MSDAIESLSVLEACIGKVPAPMNLKVIDHLDEGALRWIAASPILFAAFGDDTDIGLTLAGGLPGFVHSINASRLKLPTAVLDEPNLARKGFREEPHCCGRRSIRIGIILPLYIIVFRHGCKARYAFSVE
jgi:hypothetical protein